MLVDYLSSGCFIGSTIFITGLWFGVFGAYGIYRHNRMFLVFISMSTLLTPALTYMFFVSKTSPQYAEMQSMYGAIAGFVIPTLLAEITIAFHKRSEAQTVPETSTVEVKRTSRQAVRVKAAGQLEPEQPIVQISMTTEARKPAKPTLRMEAEEERKMINAKAVEEARKPVKATKPPMQAEPEEERKVVYAKTVAEEHKTSRASKPLLQKEPEADRKEVFANTAPEEPRQTVRQAKTRVNAEAAAAEERRAANAKAVAAARKQGKPTVYEDFIEEPQVVYVKPVEKRKASPPRQLEEPVASPGRRSSGGFNKVLRYAAYVFTFLLICLFPPYLQKYTNDHIWMFIGSNNIRPSFSLDYTFLIYELVLLAIVVTGIEFCRKNIFSSEDNYDMNANSYK